MCGIVGVLDVGGKRPPQLDDLTRMLGSIRHRGPDSFGVYLDDHVGLGSARLSIVDLAGGTQPISNEDQTIWIVFNGEIFNHLELRAELIERGHRFTTHTDTEVIVHLYEERGESCVEALNGQFAFAIWNTRSQELFLARDRLGVRPLFYTLAEGAVIFGSEIKSILVDPRVARDIDRRALDQVFTFWAPLPGTTAFRDVLEVRPGHTLLFQNGKFRARQYWQIDFPPNPCPDGNPEEVYVEAFRHLLFDATRLRLRADVPVGAYLSGGLDSAATTAVARALHPGRLCTFSISFEDESFSEEQYQQTMVRHLDVEHATIRCTDADIGRVFPDVIWHAEVPTLRTAPAPMFLLSELVHRSGFKVVLTGEGADEFLGGYDIFKEDRIRRFWSRAPDSSWRPLALRRIYPDIPGLQKGDLANIAAFFGQDLSETGRKGYSHLVRWRNTSRLKRFYSEATRRELDGYDALAEVDAALDDRSRNWHPLSRAQSVEVATFLSPYLLSTQGDRMAMAHSVEGRFPFLDYRLVDFCNQVPPRLKLRGLNEKYLLKRSVEDLVPEAIRGRIKRPYRAPIHRPFFGGRPPDYVSDLLAPTALARTGYFNPAAVGRLVEKARRTPELGETDSMALVGILSAQLLHDLFVDNFAARIQGHPVQLAALVDRSTASGRPLDGAQR